MHDIDVRPEQPFLFEPLPSARSPRRPATLMHRGNDAEVHRHSEIMNRDFERGIVWTKNRCTNANQAAHAVFNQPFKFGSWMRNFPEAFLTRFRIRLRRAVKEKSSDAGFEQSIYRRIIVCRRAISVAPVLEG